MPTKIVAGVIRPKILGRSRPPQLEERPSFAPLDATTRAGTLEIVMSASVSVTASSPSRASLDAVPWVDVAGNARAALFAGKRFTTMLREVIALRRGPGQLTMAEYFYYRLWDRPLSLKEKTRYVGKTALHGIHLACNDHAWYAVTQDKLLFHAAATGAGLPVPELLAVVHSSREAVGKPALATVEATASVLRDPALYPFFAKPIAGIYSLGAISADRLDTRARAYLGDGTDCSITDLAADLTADDGGMLIQRRLRPAVSIARDFGDRLWSIRLLVLLTDDGPQVTRAVAKIPAPGNVADNFWRPGNMIAAVNVGTGTTERVVRGTGMEMEVDFDHPETGKRLVGAVLPDWPQLLDVVQRAARTFPGVRTQSWDVALTDNGPVLLEVNWGGDLNLAQLAYGYGVLDERYAAHLRMNAYQKSKAQRRLGRLREAIRRD
ncbi:hypothetical protein HN018_23535 (plasmid) [Lichenicola cladoniae]|uniref:Alpha-L-glutamate ligase-related protein ATP-grasp domain-containing protein n=1 Tax=Lichenicola cladoniae TaxID=1484109 RepID=A0A6M8HX82_9PROT|nr:sugar-transfer associated ATP-grasp domain-containing protein [Lichenicola cladoniae]NPD66307.1 hypothetical protein [Acetobacteraceae bacterium]QKE93159.1 hypothetical protein HN018_23535 [Lichenicola cladoniae]